MASESPQTKDTEVEKKTVYFEVREHGATLRDSYRPLRAADLRELAQQALEAAQKMERCRADWVRDAIHDAEAFLDKLHAELAELERAGDNLESPPPLL